MVPNQEIMINLKKKKTFNIAESLKNGVRMAVFSTEVDFRQKVYYNFLIFYSTICTATVGEKGLNKTLHME